MNQTTGSICLSELNLGFPLPYPYTVVCRAKLAPKVCTKASMAVTFGVQEALQDKLIDTSYANVDELQKQLATFVKRYAGFGAQRDAMKVNHLNQYEDTINKCRSFIFDPIYDAYAKRRHVILSKVLKNSGLR